MDAKEVMDRLLKAGIPEHDAKVITDCIITRRSCSWVNTDPVDREAVRKLLALNAEHKFGLELSIKEVATRGKYIWEVKVSQK